MAVLWTPLRSFKKISLVRCVSPNVECQRRKLVCPEQLPEGKATSMQSGHSVRSSMDLMQLRLGSLEKASWSWVAWDSFAG